MNNERELTRRRFIGGAGAVAAAAVLPSGRLAARDDGRIRVGQIGTGHAHAAGKMAAYRRSSDWEVVGIAEPDAELRRRAERAEVYRDLRWTTVDELLETPGLHAVAIETRVRDLLEHAGRAIEAGKHIHLDKPAGASLPRFRRLVGAARSRELVIQMGYMYRYSPAVLLLREFLAKGWLGEPFEVHAVMSKVVEPASRKDHAEFRGGMMFELGCHIIDLLVGVLGRPEEVVPFAQHVGAAEDDLMDNTLAVCRYPRALATVKSSGVEVDGFARRHFVVCGSEGTFHIQPLDAPDVRVSLAEPRGPHPKGRREIAFGNYPRYVGDAADLARVIRGETEFEYSYEHDLWVQETVLRASRMPLE